VAAITAAGAALIALHNLLDPIRAASLGALAPLWTILHAPGIVVASPAYTVFAAYPLVPWIGVTAVGFGLGRLYSQPDDRRRGALLRLSIALIVGFIVLRWVNGYGDPSPWTAQRSPLFSVLSFLNTTKYPPSLLFLLMTLGPALLILWTADARAPSLFKPAVVVGKVPFFYFVLHLSLIHLLAVAVCYARYGTAHWMFESPRLDQYPITPPPGWGYSLPIVYIVWAIVVVALYPLCRWYARVKEQRGVWWLSYL
jgi:uncharacterized membrane protein